MTGAEVAVNPGKIPPIPLDKTPCSISLVSLLPIFYMLTILHLVVDV